MASETHLRLSNTIKDVHRRLRERTKEIGFEQAWNQHLTECKMLAEYSKSMKNLAETWDHNFHTKDSKQNDRTLWCIQFCREYFQIGQIKQHQQEKEWKIILELQKTNPHEEYKFENIEKLQNSQIDLLDVGSCYDPFRKFNDFCVTAIDIAPATASVWKCDFLNVTLGNRMIQNDTNNSISSLANSSFDIIVFSLLLEYLPTSSQRKLCCEKAYDLLRTEGLLLIITPDSKHIGANAKLMKNWRYTLALMGFNRIKYEKMEHITCMAFRKCLNKKISIRWADIHAETYMTDDIFIPQDFNLDEENVNSFSSKSNIKYNEKDNLLLFQELPEL